MFFFKSRIRETKNLLTDADSRTDTILERIGENFNLLYPIAIEILLTL